MSRAEESGPGGNGDARLPWFERQFAETQGCLIVLLAILLNGPALILGLIGLEVCRDRVARRNAWLLVIVGGAVTIVGIVLMWRMSR